MPVRRLAVIAALGLLLLSGGMPSVGAEEAKPVKADPHVVTLRADPSCPQNCDPNSDHPGYVIELAEKIYGAAGYKLDYKLLSWSRTLIEVRQGNIDGAVAGIKSDAPDFRYPEEEVGTLHHGFAVRKGSGWTWKGVQSLDGKILGAIPDYQYFPELKAYIDQHADDPKRVQMVAMFNALELNLKKLSVGRVDVVCDDMNTMRYFHNLLHLENSVELVGPVGEAVPQYIGFTPNSERGAKLAKLWDDGVRRMRANGELQKVLDRYGAKDWK